MMRIEYCGLCDKGLNRAMNQDAVFMGAQGDKAVFAVADGMGGHRHGEAASGTIIAEIKEWWERLLAAGDMDDFGEMVCSLQQQIERANRIIYEYYNKVGVCGSTIVVLLICKQDYCILSSGDSRIYYLNGRDWRQLTEDDVWENLPEIRSSYSVDQQKEHTNYGKLTRAIGIARSTAINGRMGVLKRGDRFLLCSDGLYKMCGESAIKELLKKYRGRKNGDRLLGQTLQKIYDNGAKDNIAAVLVRWGA